MKILRNLGAEDGGSPSSEDAMSAESSTAKTDGQQGDKANQSLNDFLIQEKLIKPSDESGTADQKDQSSEVQKLNETAEGKDIDPEKKKENVEAKAKETEDLGKETEKEEKVEKTEEETKAEEKLNNNPRFQEVVSQRNEARDQIKTIEPKAKWCDEVHNFMFQNQVTQEQYQAAIKFAALCNLDPEAALKEITPIVEKLQGFTGNKLPDDLQKEVDNGDLTLNRAKEIATLRARTEFGSKKLDHERKTYEQQQRENTTREMAKAAQSWQSAKMQSDPDYKPKSKSTDEDGKFEEVSDKYIAMLHRTDASGNYVNPVNSPSDMVALMEKAYVAVNGFTKKVSGLKSPTRKSLSSNGSSTMNGSRNGDPSKAKTMQEAMQIGYQQSLANRQ